MPRQVSQREAPLSAGAQRVWDLPIRLAHWLLAALIAFSWWSVSYHHTDWHIWSGIAILTLLVFRFLWGLFGSSTARFANFVRGPRQVRADLRGEWRGIGHSPLGALSVVALFGAVGTQIGLGLVAQDPDGIYMGPLARLVSSDASDRARDLHEDWFNVILALVALHVGTIAYYRLRRSKALTKPMITGKAVVDGDAEPMQPGKWWVALICLAAAFAVARWVVAGLPPLGS